jgi:hypothetical protein
MQRRELRSWKLDAADINVCKKTVKVVGESSKQ